MLFIVKSLKNSLPDIEIVKFKQTCLNMITKLDNPAEGYFGLAKIYCYEGKLVQAIQQLKFVNDNEDSSIVWMIVIRCILMKNKKKALKTMKMCCGLKTPRIEVYWALMKISLSGLLEVNKDIDCAEYYAEKIMEIDKYYGYLAWAEILPKAKSEKVYKSLLESEVFKPEAYIKLWNYYFYLTKNYSKALEVIEKAYLNMCYMKEYEILISLNYSKTLHKLGKVKHSIELLQIEYTRKSVYIVFLYHYARICIKSGETVFLGSAIGSLKECLKIFPESRYGHIYYWLAKAYEKMNEKILTFKSIKKSIIFLSKELENKIDDSDQEKRVKQKIEELKSLIEKNYVNTEIFSRIRFILKKFQPEMIEEFSVLVKTVKECDRLYGEILESKALWQFDYKDDALKALYNNSKTTRVKMQAFFMMAKFLRQECDYANIKKICEKMIRKCRNPAIPVQVWIKVHLIFAKCLIKLNDAPKAILIYKCLAQVQPAPYIPDLLYTRILQQATTIEDLISTAAKVSKFKEAKDHNDIKFERIQLLCSKRNLSSMVIGEGEEDFMSFNAVCNEDNQLLGSRTPEPLPKARFSRTPIGDNANPGFSVSIYYLFLYKIGKASAKFKINAEDGLMAMHDFLILHHYWMKEGIETDEKVKVKAIYWMGVLYHHNEQYQQASQTFKECQCMLFELGLLEMTEKVQLALKEYRNMGCI